MINSEWVDLIELANILELNAETLRRKCVSNEFVSRFHKNGRFKVYEIRLNSLPPEYLNIIENKTVKKEQDLQLINNNSETYANAPAWSKKQADKYLEVFTLTEGMNYRQVKAFLQEWNKNNSEKRVSYSSYYKAKIKYEKCGINGLLSHRGQGSSAALISDDYLEYYKSLYLREGGPSSFFYWTATLGYAKEKENIDVTTFPSYKIFGDNLYDMQHIQDFNPEGLFDVPPLPIDDLAEINLSSNFDKTKNYFVVQDSPLPFHIASIIPHYKQVSRI